MSTERDNEIVDFLYDELSGEDRKAFLDRMEAEPVLASRAASYSAVLTLVREQGEDIAPSTASTERLIEEARLGSRPFLSRLLWPGLLGHPAVAIATLAVLVLGLGVFAFLSGRGGSDGPGTARGPRAPKDEVATRTASDKTAGSGGTRGGIHDLARQPTTVAASEPDADKNEALAIADRARKAPDRANGANDESVRPSGRQTFGQAEALEEEKNKEVGARLAGTREGSAPALRVDQGRATRGEEKLAQRGERNAMSASPGAAVEDGGHAAGLVATTGANAKASQPKAPPRTYVHQKRSGQGDVDAISLTKPAPAPVASKPPRQDGKDGQSAQTKGQAETRSAPVLYNLASTSLSKGNISQACDLFSALVRTHRDYPRRADALLGWARCELSRGAYGRAESILQQLIREHPSWRKSGEIWLAAIQKKRQEEVLRAQRRVQADKQQQPARAAPRRATSNTSSY